MQDKVWNGIAFVIGLILFSPALAAVVDGVWFFWTGHPLTGPYDADRFLITAFVTVIGLIWLGVSSDWEEREAGRLMRQTLPRSTYEPTPPTHIVQRPNDD